MNRKTDSWEEGYVPSISGLERLGLVGFETHFPRGDCILESEREDDIWEADPARRWLCVVLDKRFDSLEVRVLIPYVNKFEGEYYFGWTTQDQRNYVDNWERSIHHDDERVIACKRVADGTEGVCELIQGGE